MSGWRAGVSLVFLVAPVALGQDPPLPPTPARGPAQVTASTGAAGPERVTIDVDGVPLADLLAQLGRTARATLAVEPGVDELVTLSLRDVPWREAVEVIAAMCRCEVEDLPGGGMYLVQPATVTLSVVDADVRDVVATISRVAGEPVFVLPDAVGRVTVDMKEVPWRDALGLVADVAGAQVTARPGLTVVGRAAIPGGSRATWRPAADGPRVDVSASGSDLQELVDAIGRLAGCNVLVDPSVDAAVSLEVVDAPWQVAVQLAARRTGCEVEERPGGILVVTRLARHCIQAVGAPPGPLLQMIAAAAGLNVVVSADVGGLVFAYLPGISFGDAVRLITAIQGWELEERGDAFVVTATARHDPPLPTSPYEADVAKLVDDVARFARERRVAELDVAMAALRDRVAGEVPAAARDEASEVDVEALELELEGLLRDVVRMAEQRQVEELITTFTRIREVLARGGPTAERVTRRLLGDGRLADLGEVSLSLQLQLEMQVGEDALRDMAEAMGANDWEALRAADARLDQVTTRMRRQERQVFHRNAEALSLRAKALRERAARLETFDGRFASLLRVTAVLVPDDPVTPKAAIVGGQIVREGDAIVDPRTGEEVEGLRVVEIHAGTVRFRYEDTEFVRELTKGR